MAVCLTALVPEVSLTENCRRYIEKSLWIWSMIYDTLKLMTMVVHKCVQKKKKTLTMFRLSCLRIGQNPQVFSSVHFGFAVSPSSGPELSKVIELVQSSLLSGSV